MSAQIVLTLPRFVRAVVQHRQPHGIAVELNHDSAIVAIAGNGM